MQTLKLTRTATGRTISLTGPGSYDELSAQQLVIFMRAKRKEKDPFCQALVLVKLFFKIPATYIKKLNKIQAMQLASLVNFLYEPALKIEKWLISSISTRHWLKRNFFYGPADGLENICFAEFFYADDRFSKYQNTNDPVKLNELIGILYRKKDEVSNQDNTGDIRIPFNKHTIEKNGLQVSGLNEDTKRAILLNYIGCRTLLAGYFKNLFPQVKEDEEKTDQPATNGSWLELAIQLARKERALGTFSEMELQNAYLVLKVLDKVIEEAEEMKEEIERLKQK
ncbi:MAG: hypothetical protein WBP45_15770 [Daejeonella sp.]